MFSTETERQLARLAAAANAYSFGLAGHRDREVSTEELAVRRLHLRQEVTEMLARMNQQDTEG